MDKKENFLSRLIKKVSDIATSVFKRQLLETKDLSPYTEEDFDRDLKIVLQKEKGIELEHIAMLKQSMLLPKEIVYSLITDIKDRDFHINKADENGDTLLHVAVQKKGLEHLVVALLNNGADATKENKSGNTPIEVAHSDKMKTAIQQFVFEKEKHSLNVRRYIRTAIKNESIIPISDTDLDIKFPPVIIKVEDVIEEHPSEVGTPKTCLHGIEPWLDEDIQGDDIYIPGITEHIHLVQTGIDECKKLLHPTVPKIQKITDQKKLPTQDTSRGAREE